jgi:translation initiation factor 3 subunit D
MDFQTPPLAINFDGWGPAPNADCVLNKLMLSLDLENFDSKYPITRMGRVCDFSASGMKWQEQQRAKGKGKGKFQQLMPAKEDDGFALVDFSVGKGKAGGKGRGKSKGKGKTIDNYQEGLLGQRQKISNVRGNDKGKGKGKGPGGKGGAGRGAPRRNDKNMLRDWAVQTRADWDMALEIQLGQLAKCQIDHRLVTMEDVKWCGRLHNYNRDMDRIMVRTETRLKRFEDVDFYNVSTSDDPHLSELVKEEDVTVVATDHILAALASASRSMYSWDLIITKAQGKIVIDKRDGAPLDFLTVHETAMDPPENVDPTHRNAPQNLNQEASMINQNFSQMVLEMEAPAIEFDEPNPFDEDGTAASCAYRYRKLTLPGNPKDESEIKRSDIVIAFRSELSGVIGTEKYVLAKALNEYDPKLGISWRTGLEAKHGAVMANEIKNNSFKMGRWAVQSVLAGASVIKLGYVTRATPDNAHSHMVLGVQTKSTDDFSMQIGMDKNNVFGVLRSVLEQVLEWEDGKYLCLKDPMKPIVRFYQVPWDYFDEEDEDDDDYEDEGPDVDEDGNVAPEQK